MRLARLAALLALPGGSRAPALLELCLDGCDGTGDSQCSAAGTADEGDAFGVPIPVLAARVPVCLVTRYGAQGVGGSLDLASGTASLVADVVSEVHLRLGFSELCPRCLSTTGAPGSQGRCSATAEAPGATCVVEAVGRVAQAPGDQIYPLSSSCLPAQETNVGNLGVPLPLTTGTSELAGALPCAGQQQDDQCEAGPCTVGICTGGACVALDAAGRCLDHKGGLSQACCSSDSAVPCFPTRGGGSLVRSGVPFLLDPPWGDPQYPKAAAGGALVGTFCAPATGSPVIDLVAGLPGPGALVLPLGEVTVSD